MAKYEQKEMDNWEHSHRVVAKRTVNVTTDFQTLVDVASSTITYVGEGAYDLAASDDGWMIEKIDESTNPITVKHVIGVWNNRASLTYH